MTDDPDGLGPDPTSPSSGGPFDPRGPEPRFGPRAAIRPSRERRSWTGRPSLWGGIIGVLALGLIAFTQMPFGGPSPVLHNIGATFPASTLVGAPREIPSSRDDAALLFGGDPGSWDRPMPVWARTLGANPLPAAVWRFNAGDRQRLTVPAGWFAEYRAPDGWYRCRSQRVRVGPPAIGPEVIVTDEALFWRVSALARCRR